MQAPKHQSTMASRNHIKYQQLLESDKPKVTMMTVYGLREKRNNDALRSVLEYVLIKRATFPNNGDMYTMQHHVSV